MNRQLSAPTIGQIAERTGMHWLIQHAGISTAVAGGSRYERAVSRARMFGTGALELSAETPGDLDGVEALLADPPEDFFDFGHLSVSAPVRKIGQDPSQMIARLAALPVDAVIFRPDTIFCAREHLPQLSQLGRKALFENLDHSALRGQRVEELRELLISVPDSRLCFNITHACSIDDGLGERFAEELREQIAMLHIGSRPRVRSAESRSVRLGPASECGELMNDFAGRPVIFGQPVTLS